MLTLKNISKVFKMGNEEVWALKQIDLAIKKGEFISVFGKSGSGKSTLLNIMAGLDRPTNGEIYIMNQPIHEMKETQITLLRKRYIGFIFQAYNLLTSHTALENVMLPLTFANINEKERRERGEEMLNAVGLYDRKNHLPKQMSGGQQQRVSIARAFVNQPQIVFADEPTGNLDSNTSDSIMQLMLEMIQKHNQTFVMVTHDDDTSEYANRIIHMKDGNIEHIEDKTKMEEYV
jgi:putative ABC transport system ATP-binding protein